MITFQVFCKTHKVTVAERDRLREYLILLRIERLRRVLR
jgi:hypothetical protein